ncbi:hypothetical protein HAT86_15030 [Roseovarius gahaiensis]|uniref:Uncharacterized protein n=1 Tax=Roseovarius gahaiensis TaxID=2716691 RepID=A0A967BD07_9RHOB|nr:hypothetical protein [Roseovarius gahaiensis]NHQ75765.1 hypothetical protein [Roseovarius gahaiensis]
MPNTPKQLISPASEQTHMQQAIQALHMAQITDDYQKVVSKLAGELYDDVCLVFPGHLQMLYLLTHVRRRQVWNAVIAADETQEILGHDKKGIVALRHALLKQKSTQLLQDAYGEVPNSFEALLGRLGNVAQHYDTYRDLFELARNGDPKLRKQLLQEKPLKAELVKRLAGLPARLRSVKFAKGFECETQIKRFVDFLGAWEDMDMPEKAELDERLYKAIHHGGGVSEAIRQIYIRLPFPEQTVPNCEKVKFLENGCALEDAAKRYDNCLATLVPQAVRGETQFYEWKGRAHAIVAIKKKRGHWEIDEIKLRKNREPAPEFADTIQRHFKQYGVGEHIQFSQLIEKFLSPSAFEFDECDLFDPDAQVDFEYLLNAA